MFSHTISVWLTLLLFHHLAVSEDPSRQTDSPVKVKYPIIPNCEQVDIDLVLITDASVADYDQQLAMATQLVELFWPPRQQLRRPPHTASGFRAAMAVSGAHGAAQGSHVTEDVHWLFELRSFSTKSEVKQAVMADAGRQRAMASFPHKALEFVHTSMDLSTDLLQSNSSKTKLVILIANEINVWGVQDELAGVMKREDWTLVLVLLTSNTLRSLGYPCTFNNTKLCFRVTPKEMLTDHSFPILLCGTCYHGWFISEQIQISEREVLRASCYKLAPSKDNYALKALDDCQTMGASLISVETAEKSQYLSHAFREHCYVREDSLVRNPCSPEEFVVFIGLFRDSSSVGRRFRWVNGLPVVFNQWVPPFPQGGYVHGCTVWMFALNPYPSSHEGILGQWYDLGCGQKFPSTVFTLCEWAANQEGMSFYSSMGRPSLPSERSIQSMIARTELIICQEMNEPLWERVFFASGTDFLITGCSILLNNTGKIQRVSLPLADHLLFHCDEEFYSFGLAYSRVCDTIADCPNGRDEDPALCKNPWEVREDGFMCASGKRIEAEARCDLFPDCLDGSDEVNCQSCRLGLCSDGRCVPQTWLVDDETDCLSFLAVGQVDLLNSVNGQENCTLICNRTQCVPWEKLGDGKVDCMGPEGPIDEVLGSVESTNCGGDLIYLNIWAPKCIYYKDRFGEVIGCRNMHHLTNCGNFSCPEGYAKCPSSYCIPSHYINDLKKDCPLGEDEPFEGMRGLDQFPKGYFQCLRESTIALHPDRVCDGSRDCPFGEDESSCQMSCMEGFLCAQGFVVPYNFNNFKPLNDLSFIDQRTRKIVLSGIDLSRSFSSFSRLRLPNLIELGLSNCKIRNIDINTDGLWRVVWLDLSHNLITTIALLSTNNVNPIYYYMGKMQFLNLSHNYQLTFFDPETLAYIGNIKSLDLSHTAISVFPAMRSISGSLLYLNLSHTRITRIPPLIFSQGRHIFNDLDLRELSIDEIHPDMFVGLGIRQHLYSSSYKFCCWQLRAEGMPEHTCLYPKDPLSSCSNLMHNPVLRILQWVVGAVSVLGNLAVLTVRLAKSSQTLALPYAQFVTHLGASDLLMGVYLFIIAGTDLRYQDEYVWRDTPWRESWLCHIAGFLSTLSSEVSAMMILLITTDRYLVIRYPYGQYRLTRKVAAWSTLLVWLVGFTLAAVPLFPSTRRWELYSSNGVCLGLPLMPQHPQGWHFTVGVFIGLNFVICLCIAAGQIAIFRAMTRSRCPPASATLSGVADGLNARMRQDLKVARRLAVVAFTNLVCWLPIAVLGLMALAGHSLGAGQYAWAAVFVMPVNSAINPLIYTLPNINERLRWAVARFLEKCEKRAKTRQVVVSTQASDG